MNNIKLDDATKEFIHKTATLLGVDVNVIRTVYEYMLFTWMLELSGNNDKIVALPIPFMGTVNLKFSDDFVAGNTNDLEVDAFLLMHSQFKDLIHEAKTNGATMLSSYIQKNILDKLSDTILQQ